MSKRSEREKKQELKKREPTIDEPDGPQREEGASQTKITAVSSYYEGPLPSPQILEQYEAIVPNAAERIFKAFENQTNHRMELEKSVISSDIKRAYVGLSLGFAVSMTALLGGVYTAVQGHPGAGGTIATASVVALAGVFVYGSSMRKAERSTRKDQKKIEPT